MFKERPFAKKATISFGAFLLFFLITAVSGNTSTYMVLPIVGGLTCGAIFAMLAMKKGEFGGH